MRSPKNLVDEMEFMKKKYNVTAFSFMDSTFIINNKKIIAFNMSRLNMAIPVIIWE